MLIQIVLFAVGLGVLILGAQRLVEGSSSLALRMGMTPLLVGLTVVAFGTSAPEMAVSVKAALSGQSEMSVGNIVGSNIFNVLFILGLAALISPLIVARKLIYRDVPAMMVASLLLLFFAWDGLIAKWEASILVGLLALYTWHLFVDSKQETNQEDKSASEEDEKMGRSPLWSVFFVFVGLIMLVFGSRLMVDAAIQIAQYLGIDEVVVGLTIVAAGTSLPEVAASVMATLKGERDIAVGNVIGSNIFNIFAVGGISGLVSSGGLPVSSGLVQFDLIVLIATAIACLPIFFSGHSIDRWEGFVFLFYYVAYTSYLILTATSHSAIDEFQTAMIWFAMPLTILTIGIILFRSRRLSTHAPN